MPGLACFNRWALRASGRNKIAVLCHEVPLEPQPQARRGRRAAARGGERRGRRGAFQPGTAAEQLDVLTALADARSAGQPLSRDQGCATRYDTHFLILCMPLAQGPVAVWKATQSCVVHSLKQMAPCRNVEQLRRNWEQVRRGARDFPLPSSATPPSPPLANSRASAVPAAHSSPAVNGRRREAASRGAGPGAGSGSESEQPSAALHASWAALEALRRRGARRSPPSPDNSPPRGPRGLARALASGVLRTVGRSAGPSARPAAREAHAQGFGNDRGALRRGVDGRGPGRRALPAQQAGDAAQKRAEDAARRARQAHDARQQRPPAGQLRVGELHSSAAARPARPAGGAGFSMGRAALDPGVGAGAAAPGAPGASAVLLGGPHGRRSPTAWAAGANEPQPRSVRADAKRQRLGSGPGWPQRGVADAPSAAPAAPPVRADQAKAGCEQAAGVAAGAPMQAAGAARQANGASPPWLQPGSAHLAPAAAASPPALRAVPAGVVPPSAALRAARAPASAAEKLALPRGAGGSDYWARHGLPPPPSLHGVAASGPAPAPASACAASVVGPPAPSASGSLGPPPPPPRGGFGRGHSRVAQSNGAQPSEASGGMRAASPAPQGPARAPPPVWDKAAAAAAVKARLKPVLASGGMTRERFKAVARAAAHALVETPDLADHAAREAAVAQAVEAALRAS